LADPFASCSKPLRPMNDTSSTSSLPTPQVQRTDLAQLSDDELFGLVGKSWLNFKETATAVLVEYQRRGKTPSDLARDLHKPG
jgi:hypothetical protein